ncbi:oxysterol-binding protein [Gluconobacter morbifer]|uniref:oxysterol-binding protein n=1 Tax=Gluconobacter morbifer TaxID=479935 RepID=UPI0002D2D3D4|nr:oxysterol-binding protein [Gluconobacter morbifer]
MTEHSHTLPSQQALKHRLEDVQRKLARAEKENSEHAHALRAEVKKLEAQLQD